MGKKLEHTKQFVKDHAFSITSAAFCGAAAVACATGNFYGAAACGLYGMATLFTGFASELDTSFDKRYYSFDDDSEFLRAGCLVAGVGFFAMGNMLTLVSLTPPENLPIQGNWTDIGLSLGVSSLATYGLSKTAAFLRAKSEERSLGR